MSMTTEEKIAKFDKRRDMHYYVYFSSSTYKHQIDVIQFKKKSDLKNEYYKNKRYFSTHTNAKAYADKLNAKDKNISHLIGRAVSNFRQELYNLRHNIEKEKRVITQNERKAINVLEDSTNLITKLLNKLLNKES